MEQKLSTAGFFAQHADIFQYLQKYKHQSINKKYTEGFAGLGPT